jgi:hypothetical protein
LSHFVKASAHILTFLSLFDSLQALAYFPGGQLFQPGVRDEPAGLVDLQVYALRLGAIC